MVTNDLKKGNYVKLRNGWRARIWDNKKGNIRMAEVFGIYTEIGSVYAHDIVSTTDADGNTVLIEHTPQQIKLRQTVGQVFGD